MKEQKLCTEHFEGFQEYWQLTKGLDRFQRDILFEALPEDQRLIILKSFKDEGWEDLLMRNKLDELVSQIKEEIGQDLISIRCKVLMGKCHYMKKSQWLYISDRIKESASKKRHLNYILGNIQVECEGNDSVCLTSTRRI